MPPNRSTIAPADRFGMLRVLHRVDPPAHVGGTHRYWRCRCDCGAVIDVRQNSLATGNTCSCGCLRGHNLTRRDK